MATGAEESHLENLTHALTTGSCFLSLKWDRWEYRRLIGVEEADSN